MITRRALLGAAGLAGIGAVATGCASPGRDETARLLPSRAALPERFSVPFVVPPVAEPTERSGGVTRYAITQRRAQVEILPGTRTEIFGYGGGFPGPTVVARRGEQVVITHRNELPVPTAVHLHGGHTAAVSDGFPTDLVRPVGDHDHGGPGESVGERGYTYDNDQPATTLWYHDHRMDFSAPQVWRGLAGLHLITDDVEAALPLPTGDRDLPLLIMDRSFEADGSFRYPSLDPTLVRPPGVTPAYVSGVLGDVLLVNGRPWPRLEVDGARHRLRLVNGSNARRYRLTLSPPPPDGSGIVQVGSDGGLLERPVRHDEVQLSAGERCDVVVDFGAYPVGAEVTLTNGLGLDSTDAVMRFVVARRAADDSRVPDRLTTVEPLVPGPDAVVRDWRFSRAHSSGPAHWRINGLPFDPDRMDARPRLGEVEIWRFATDVHHPIHVHLSPFQVRRRGSGGPGPFDGGWKDTVDLRPTEYVEIAIRFERHLGRYLVHCHNLEHEDMMMMSAFETVA